VGVKKAQKALEDAALSHAKEQTTESLASLLSLALAYAAEKKRAANSRDKWKQKKHLTKGKKNVRV
jgi:hypothetical protein